MGEQTTVTKQVYDPDCYLCPGNTRASGQTNPQYTGVYVFDNDFAALQSGSDQALVNSGSLFRSEPETGVCRVLCFSPDHQRTLSELTTHEIHRVVDSWSQQSRELGMRYPEGSVQIFENKGSMMGCSNPHPHGQIWAQPSVPNVLKRELAASETYLQGHGRPLLQDYLKQELVFEERIVYCNEHFVVLVPYWATWPFETLICARDNVAQLPKLSSRGRWSLADALGQLSRCYDSLFGVSFPYSAGLHQAPACGRWDDSFSLHMHFYPPLLRSAEVRKFMVGYEMLAEPQRDLTPETAAEVLRSLSDSFPTAAGEQA